MYMPPSLGKPSLTFVQYGQEQQTSVIYKSDNTEAARLPDYPTTVPRDTTTCTAFGGGMEGQIFPWARHTRGRATRVPQKCIRCQKHLFLVAFLRTPIKRLTYTWYLVPRRCTWCTVCSVPLALCYCCCCAVLLQLCGFGTLATHAR